MMLTRFASKWINRDSGRRSDSAHAYIHSTRQHYSNLHLVVNTKVEKVLIEGDRAVGIRTCPTKPLSASENRYRDFKARKFVIVSGGTLSSPLILQRSGIGDPEKLRKAGVKPLVDLPGVGLNFQDHYLTFATYRAKPHVESFDDFVRGDKETQEKVFQQVRPMQISHTAFVVVLMMSCSGISTVPDRWRQTESMQV